MEETLLFRIVHCCSDELIEGCDNLTLEQVDAWMHENGEALEEPAPCGDTQKYIVLPALTV